MTYPSSVLCLHKLCTFRIYRKACNNHELGYGHTLEAFLSYVSFLKTVLLYSLFHLM